MCGRNPTSSAEGPSRSAAAPAGGGNSGRLSSLNGRDPSICGGRSEHAPGSPHRRSSHTPFYSEGPVSSHRKYTQGVHGKHTREAHRKCTGSARGKRCWHHLIDKDTLFLGLRTVVKHSAVWGREQPQTPEGAKAFQQTRPSWKS